jgi:hypothetical protein
MRLSLPPDRAVLGFTQADLTHRLRVMTRFAQSLRQRRRQLRIDPDVTAWRA